MPAPDSSPILSVRNLNVRFGRNSIPAVSDVSFDVGRERVGIVGESGSGKSTTGRAAMRLLPKSATVTAERMDFLSQPLLEKSERQMGAIRGSEMALIMQDPRYSLNPVLPIGKQVAEAAEMHLALKGAAARDAARNMLLRVRISDPDRVMGLYPHQISGGMGQRVMIAMMLLAKPKLVIADEPTSALDVSVRKDVLLLLDEMVRENDAGLILISHDIRMVAAFCERVLVMYGGRVVETLTKLEDAQHPYTRGLIAAMPDPRNPVRRLKVLDRQAIDAEVLR
ncbi:peptide ABC transporter ATP-binding protein [Agrobacterium tumefaciens]|uniref:ABC transporter, nucleotide binding/ATPase protein (Dipeptide) n=1 Tax=Agrobacterium fabrum (strain C58 / ATCC 33970) TaxID=176299 RepID=Q7CVF1_AGRFC|nr:ABC transporter ATP-binding protein [Agrobacterium fabrum]KEY54176.1 peptide ABC transporter ATP-binding protein [Agrobacterium tumefaciens]AAK88826.2 ABC transporter, nucleotide binding/ATPase protein (dipeptide) [Agrobacterium fabrum str. C58]KJX85502.1 Spermidine/putrescine import ATP-binding protein potA [Agrobacterium tumefaciens]MCX2876393.1 ABC transporter ATP-binding protein [Agrobacterium fabrum]NMV72047.1 ABC transporter ATP-binding protein [Agrobacterium fabrum]